MDECWQRVTASGKDDTFMTYDYTLEAKTYSILSEINLLNHNPSPYRYFFPLPCPTVSKAVEKTATVPWNRLMLLKLIVLARKIHMSDRLLQYVRFICPLI